MVEEFGIGVLKQYIVMDQGLPRCPQGVREYSRACASTHPHQQTPKTATKEGRFLLIKLELAADEGPRGGQEGLELKGVLRWRDDWISSVCGVVSDCDGKA
ncbi:hypothetical protein HS088_TW05G00111 [Tripterygium wilfordii]|uniref:Uncharacterized protein n=1 Tax=Tripterygium wilfordii TaxID=458696 RepID=A0A7J7DLZ9_TRIWF|nr:hypothetical protein HS088_TW05G00111 [Tripterygium wilfordii]